MGVIRLRRMWHGQYRHFRDVPSCGLGWDTVAYRNWAVAEVRRVLAAANGHSPDDLDENRSLLGLMAAVVSREGQRGLRVLDLGGGPGMGFATILPFVDNYPDVDYHVVERPPVCEDGRRLFDDERRIHFHTVVPDLPNVDIALAAGVIESFEDWAGALRTLCAQQPTYILLMDVCCGTFRTYASGFTLIQGSIVPFWFLNAEEIVDVMTHAGYRAIFRALKSNFCSQDNFPEALRLPGGHPTIFLFARK